MRQDFEGRIGPRIASCERGHISVSPETGRFIHSQCPRNRVRYTTELSTCLSLTVPSVIKFRPRSLPPESSDC